jgi:cytochrome c oxidase subunit 2
MIRRVGAFAALVVLASCSGEQAMLDTAGQQASDVAGIWYLMLWVCGVMYALMMMFLGAALWRARGILDNGAREGDQRLMRRGLTAWTALIVVGIVVLAGASFAVDRRLARVELGDAVRIKLTASQWWWKADYEDPVAQQRFTTANELHLPAGRSAIVELRSDDVIHSFWIPNLAGKIDMIPGRTTYITLTPKRTGTFRGQCSEFCGLQHAHMALDVAVKDEAGFAAWREAQLQPARAPQSEPEVRGLDVFKSRECAACHQITGTAAAGQTGPDLTHVASRASLAAGTLPMSRENMIAWLADPQTAKPGNHMPIAKLSDQDRENLATYLMSLQ